MRVIALIISTISEQSHFFLQIALPFPVIVGLVDTRQRDLHTMDFVIPVSHSPFSANTQMTRNHPSSGGTAGCEKNNESKLLASDDAGNFVSLYTPIKTQLYDRNSTNQLAELDSSIMAVKSILISFLALVSISRAEPGYPVAHSYVHVRHGFPNHGHYHKRDAEPSYGHSYSYVHVHRPHYHKREAEPSYGHATSYGYSIHHPSSYGHSVHKPMFMSTVLTITCIRPNPHTDMESHIINPNHTDITKSLDRFEPHLDRGYSRSAGFDCSSQAGKGGLDRCLGGQKESSFLEPFLHNILPRVRRGKSWQCLRYALTKKSREYSRSKRVVRSVNPKTTATLGLLCDVNGTMAEPPEKTIQNLLACHFPGGELDPDPDFVRDAFSVRFA
ncbi:unnamed protein product [Lepeophtheirus salmonis]|uniref:(salmon louse) hypothetical protein n=1 Tax=Lepeophtheirus salmonis TaxID=72036 RepID=A0A7R8HAH8_LEPSM|nr:unnamed protein product [Lepeophtheirus salmonis]CAF2971386.1 unnamed protein product [Lepeophtheirus salmonis]